MLLELLEGVQASKYAAAGDKTTLADLAQELSQLKDKNPEALATAFSTIFSQNLITPQDDPSAATTLASLIINTFLLPSTTPSPPKAAENALSSLSSLTSYSPTLPPPDLIRIIAYTNPQDPWTTPSAASSASTILTTQLNPSHLPHLIRSSILDTYLRPLFSRSRSERITPAGRKAHYPETPGRDTALPDEAETKPWKHSDIHAVTVFSWAVTHADEQLISDAWPLFLPVLLALLDDPDTSFRLRGLATTRTFVAKCPAHRLRDTGLGELLAQSILPTFNFLPSLTPEAESAQLLDAAYPAAILLARTQFNRSEDAAGKRALLATVLRDGVFTGYMHAKQHVRVVEVLARQSAAVVDELQLAATPHLKDLVPMFSEMLSDPFAAGYPEYFLAAIRGLQATMRNCWPRISTLHHQGEILKALTLGWLSLQDDESSREEVDTKELRAALTETAAMLTAISSAAGTDLADQTSQLVATDKTLEGLFA